MPELIPNPFDYITPDDEAKNALAYINDFVKDLYNALLQEIPDSRERSLAITKLQEVRMWANAGIVFDQMRTRGPSGA